MPGPKKVFSKATGMNRARLPGSPRYTYGEGVQLICLEDGSGAEGSMSGNQSEAAGELNVTTGDSVVGMDASGQPFRPTGAEEIVKTRFLHITWQGTAESSSGVAEGIDAGIGTPRGQNASRRAKNGMSMAWACLGRIAGRRRSSSPAAWSGCPLAIGATAWPTSSAHSLFPSRDYSLSRGSCSRELWPPVAPLPVGKAVRPAQK